MCADPLSVDAAQPLEHCIDPMESRQVRRALVTEGGGRLVGIVAPADVARAARHERSGELVRELSQPQRNRS